MFPISECPAIFHSCVCRCTATTTAAYPRFGDIVRGSIDGRAWRTAPGYSSRSQFESGNKGHWKRETDKNEVAIKVLSSITTKAVSQSQMALSSAPFMASRSRNGFFPSCKTTIILMSAERVVRLYCLHNGHSFL